MRIQILFLLSFAYQANALLPDPSSIKEVEHQDLLRDPQVVQLLIELLQNQTEVAPTLTPSTNGTQRVCSLPRTVAKTKIRTDAFAANFQYWILKPKLQFLKTMHPQLMKPLTVPYSEVLSADENSRMLVIYEFQKPVDCKKLVQFSEKVVSFSSEILEVSVDCECDVFVIRKREV